MKKILIFSSNGSLRALHDLIGKQLFPVGHKWDLWDDPHTIYAFDETQNKLIEVKRLGEPDIYFLHDTTSQNMLDAFLSGAGKYELYILKHTLPKSLHIKAVAELPGDHEPREKSKYYWTIICILDDNNPKKADRIIDQIFKSDPYKKAALNFLHDCLVNDDLSLTAAKYPDLSSQAGLITGFQKDIAGLKIPETDKIDPKNRSKYFIALREFRDQLLSVKD